MDFSLLPANKKKLNLRDVVYTNSKYAPKVHYKLLINFL